MNRNLLSDILTGVWMINRQTADGYLPLIVAQLKGENPAMYDADQDRRSEVERQASRSLCFATFHNGVYQISEYGSAKRPEDAPPDSIAVLNITDVITKYDTYCGPSGMKTKANLLRRVDNNKNIKGVVLVIDSGGGEGYAAMLMNETIRSMETPVVAQIDDFACSAAYYIASACEDIFVNSKMARVGSIGTYVTVADYTEFWKQHGINLLEIYADLSSDKNQDYYQVIKYMQSAGKEGSLEPLKNMVNTFNAQFLSDVKTNRSGRINSDDSLWNSGKVFFAEEAEKIGLIDGVQSLDETIKSMYKLLNS